MNATLPLLLTFLACVVVAWAFLASPHAAHHGLAHLLPVVLGIAWIGYLLLRYRGRLWLSWRA